jgi:thiol peroxidase
MSQVSLGGNPVNVGGEFPAKGSKAPSFTLTAGDLSAVSSESLAGQRIILNIFPSIDTAVCAASVRTFNARAAGLDNTTVVCASADLPFAAKRFCGAEGIESVVTGSSFKNPEFAQNFGVAMLDGRLAGLLARAVVVIGSDGTVLHSELVPNIAQEPDYDAAIAALG